jgi:hypothetical protein
MQIDLTISKNEEINGFEEINQAANQRINKKLIDSERRITTMISELPKLLLQYNSHRT